MGVDGVSRGRWDNTLTKRTTPRPTDCPSKGFFEIRLAISRPWQTTISATNGSRRATSARAWVRVTGCRMTSVPAAPILTAPRCFNAWASLVGRKVLWPPTLTPLRKTTSASRFPSASLLEKLHSRAVVLRSVTVFSQRFARQALRQSLRPVSLSRRRTRRHACRRECLIARSCLHDRRTRRSAPSTG
jgi:hypothetical protein